VNATGTPGSRVARPRRKARELVLRVLYQAEITGEPVAEVVEDALGQFTPRGEVRTFARSLCLAAAERREEIDRLLQDHSRNWALGRMASIDRNVMRSAVAEMMTFADTDARVILDEAVSIARRFGTDDSGRFVNGMLDRIARVLRPGELGEGG